MSTIVTLNAIKKIPNWLLILLAATVGVCCGFIAHPVLMNAAAVISEIFIRLLKLVSGPIIFLSLLSTLTGMKDMLAARSLGLGILRYTLLTTVIASSVALILFVVIAPASPANAVIPLISGEAEKVNQSGYLDYLMMIIPDNIFEPFIQGQVISILLMALVLSIAVLSLPTHHKTQLANLFSAMFAAVMQVTRFILYLLPLAVWAMVTEFVHELEYSSDQLSTLALYLVCVVGANLVQSMIVLPLFLKWKKIDPIKTFQGALPALSVAFLTKSSSAALPVAINIAETRLNIKPEIAKFGLPLCITINMNACAGFILITVLYVCGFYGITYSPIELIGWVFIATLAAIGNAGVPMGCYLLASSILSTMHVPLYLMGVILPIYVLIDMLESAINVWSDTCVVSVVNKERTA